MGGVQNTGAATGEMFCVDVRGDILISAGSAFTSGGEKDEQYSGDVGLYPWDDETRVWGIVVVVIWGERLQILILVV